MITWSCRHHEMPYLAATLRKSRCNSSDTCRSRRSAVYVSPGGCRHRLRSRRHFGMIARAPEDGRRRLMRPPSLRRTPSGSLSLIVVIRQLTRRAPRSAIVASAAAHQLHDPVPTRFDAFRIGHDPEMSTPSWSSRSSSLGRRSRCSCTAFRSRYGALRRDAHHCSASWHWRWAWQLVQASNVVRVCRR